MERHYRRYARKFYRMLRHPRRRRASSAHQWLAEKVFDRRLWVPERHAFMNGMAAGMFFSMLPPFTPQVLISVIFCAWRRWNIPVAMACCWVSNIFTMVPQIYLQVVIGMWTVERFIPGGGRAGEAYEKLEGLWGTWNDQGSTAAFQAFWPQAKAILEPLALPWAIGIVISGVLLAVVSYALGHGFWSTFAHRVPVRHQVPHRHHAPAAVVPPARREPPAAP
jgi:uncharacterized protein (DUF2062 family)